MTMISPSQLPVSCWGDPIYLAADDQVMISTGLKNLHISPAKIMGSDIPMKLHTVHIPRSKKHLFLDSKNPCFTFLSPAKLHGSYIPMQLPHAASPPLFPTCWASLLALEQIAPVAALIPAMLAEIASWPWGSCWLRGP